MCAETMEGTPCTFALEFSLSLLNMDLDVNNTRANTANALLLRKCGICLVLNAAS